MGIWLDLKSAILMENLPDQVILSAKISSDITSGQFKGGSRSSVPWGPMDKSAEPQFQGNRAVKIRNYLKNIAAELRADDELLIFGPSKAKYEFNKILKKLKLKLASISIEAANDMTERQKMAFTRKFFQSMSE